MIENPAIAQDLARDRMAERTRSPRRVPPVPRRHRVASRLRRFADRLDS